MELQHYLDILKRRALVIVIVTFTTLLVTVAAGILILPVYEATTTVRVLLDVGVLDLSVGSTDYGVRLLNTYGRILKSEPILEEAISRLPEPIAIRLDELRERLEVEVVPNTELIAIVVEDRDPVVARDLANTLALLLDEYVRGLYVDGGGSARQVVEEQLASIEADLELDHQQLAILVASDAPDADIETLRSQIRFKEDAYDRLLDRYELTRLNESLRANSIAIVEPASLPKEPSNALGLMEVALGLFVGLFGGIGLALLIENLDTRFHSPRQLEHLTNLPVLGTVPKGMLHLGGVHHADGTDKVRSIEEAYRLLGIHLQALREERAFNTVLVTSAMPREGKSTVSSNLAQTLAERGQTVFLVEGDMRRPTIEKLFGIDGDLGLSTLLAERVSLNGQELSEVMHPAEQPSLFIIGGGSEVSNPVMLLGSPAMDQLLEYLAAQSQVTVLDAPPVLGTADVSVLAPKVDGVVLVVGQALSSREHVSQALKQLEAMRAHVLGVVFVQKGGKGRVYDFE
jgi:capsular exopolysaccharide synthesis family protein